MRWTERSWRRGVSTALLGVLASCGGDDAAGAGRLLSLTPAPAVTPAPAASPAAGPAPTASPSAASTPSLGSTDPAAPKVVLVEGDSISFIWSGNYVGIYAASRPQLSLVGLAMGGSSVGGPADRGTGANSLWARLDSALARRPTHATVLIGANDMTDWRDTQDHVTNPATWLDRLFAYTDQLRAAGTKVAVGTVLPQCLPGRADYNDLFEVRRAAANSAIRAAVGTGRIDAVIDFAADPRFGEREDACDKTLFSDGIHPDGAYPLMAEVYGPAVDQLVQR